MEGSRLTLSQLFRFAAIHVLTLTAVSGARSEQQRPAQLPARPSGTTATQAPQRMTPESKPEPRSGSLSKRSPIIRSQENLRIVFRAPEWNRDPKAIETGFAVMRDRETNRLIQLELVESSPDSSVFAGLYSIRQRDRDAFQAEIYIPDLPLASDSSEAKSFLAGINSGQTQRRPVILRRGNDGSQNLEIFTNPSMARAALAQWVQQQKQLAETAAAAANAAAAARQMPTSGAAEIVSAEQSEEAAELRRQELERQRIAASLAARIQLEQAESRKLELMVQQFRQLSTDQQKAQSEQARALAAQGLSAYQSSQFAQARDLFDRAITLDPTNRTFAYQFAVALYRLDDFNRSLVYLGFSDIERVNPVERQYFIGLNHYRLRDFATADAEFAKAEAMGDPEISPGASFYRGLSALEMSRWDEARDAFQKVLDTSKDPTLDERAESLLEQALRLKQEDEERKRRWRFSGTMGVQYDSNITQSSNSARDQGLATNIAGYRALLAGSARFRPVYSSQLEWAVQLDLMNMSSVTTSFASEQSLKNADPTVATVSFPLTYKGSAQGKGLKSDLIPSAETVVMSVEDNTSKVILNSFALASNNLVVMSENWYPSLNIEVRLDQSQLNSSVGDDDSTAVKSRLFLNNLFMLGEGKSMILTADAGLTLNSARGRNSSFTRSDLSIGLIQQWFGDLSTVAKLGAYYVDYSSRSPNRTDQNVNLTLVGSKPWSETLSLSMTLTGTLNDSSVESNDYNKYTALFGLTGQWAL
jgi:hypothetical protein